MQRKPFVILSLALLAAFLLPGRTASAFTPWGAIYDAARDERSVGDISADKEISVKIKTALLEKDKKTALSVKVYCYLRKVTLLGQLSDEAFKTFAVTTAKKTAGVKAVAIYWEAPGKEDTTKADLEIAAKIRTELVADKAISATQIDQEVFGGKVYLIGMVRSQVDADKAVAHARSVSGVKGVVSLLIASKKK